MTSTARRLAATGALAAAAATLLVAAPTSSSAAPADKGQRDLAAVRAATAKYHDVAVAEAHGYVQASPCVSVPGLGAMGFHYLNPQLAKDGTLDPAHPEALLYVPSADGMRLVGVEYIVDNTGQPRPTLLGQQLEGPLPNHGRPGTHYELHAWTWKHNPAGTFTPFNPALSCDGGAA